MKSFIMVLSAILSLIGCVNSSWAQGACMVSDMDGQVLIVCEKDQPRPINKFKKLWPGDQLELKTDTKVQLNYLAIGRIEQWNGPVQLVIEKSGARDKNNLKQPKVINLEKLTPSLKESKILNQQNVAGQIAIRGGWFSQTVNAPLNLQKKKTLESLQKTYSELRQKTAESDTTADMYYLAGLERLGQKEAMAQHIQNLLSNNGYNPDLEAMLNAL